ncbi:glutamate ABC transporter substrate-binding protein [Modestobacter sp. NPDC049651]|uniref:glutamate ABC transporter substrate-binding protein n=1 Tax=unclassified Modestobacter TaxID=2643866 RepID=UPI0033F3D44A
MRRTRTLLALAAAGALLAACSSDAGDAAEQQADSSAAVETDVDFAAGTTMARLHDAGSITIGTKFDQPGFGLLNPTTKTPEGFDVEMGKLVAAKLGIPADKIKWTETVSANREAFIENKQVDLVIATYTINDTRKQRVDFAGPYYTAGQDIMVAKGNPEKIEGPDDLAGKNVCSVEGSTPAENIRTKYPQAQLTLFDVYSKCADALRNGQVQAVTTDNVILTGLVAGNKEGFELVGNPFTEEPYGIGLAKGDNDFRTFVNDTLEDSFDNGDWADAWDATAGSITGAEAPKPPAIDRY